MQKSGSVKEGMLKFALEGGRKCSNHGCEGKDGYDRNCRGLCHEGGLYNLINSNLHSKFRNCKNTTKSTSAEGCVPIIQRSGTTRNPSPFNLQRGALLVMGTFSEQRAICLQMRVAF